MLLPEFYSTCVILSVIDLSLWFAAADVTKGENSLSSSPLFDDKIGKFMPEIIHNCFARCLASCVKKNAKDPKVGIFDKCFLQIFQGYVHVFRV